jgi:uncharacterized Zn-binding protein involved in type VI secretion
MGRWITPLIVAGVVALGVLAAADALRGRGEAEVAVETPTTTRAAPPTLREMLRREAITGFVVYSDEDCVLHSLILPRMIDDVVRTDANEPFRLCRFTEGGGRYLDEGEVPSPDGGLVARCRDQGLVIVTELESGIQKRAFRGCPPAWRPDGRLTYAQGDRIMEGSRVLYSAAELRAAVRMHPSVADLSERVRIFTHATDLAWLDERRLIVSLEVIVPDGPTMYPSVLFDGKAVVAYPSNFGNPLRNWIVSPAGSYAVAEDGTMATRDGDVITRPTNLPDGRAVAFSPDEQWLVYVTGLSTYLVGTPRNSEPGRIIRLPIPAQDFSWEAVSRGTAIGPPIRR